MTQLRMCFRSSPGLTTVSTMMLSLPVPASTFHAVRRRLLSFFVVLTCCAPMTSFGNSVILNLQKLASYDSELPHQKAFTECELATSIPSYVAKSFTKQNGNVNLVDAAERIDQGLALAIRIVELEAPGGGGWTGGKGLTLEANLYRDGSIVETVRKRQRSKGNSVGLIKATTCSILNSNARVLADQMADWVKRKLWTLGLED